MAMATISACLPTFRPLFTKPIRDAQATYIRKHCTVDVTSGRPPTNSVELSEPAATYKVWTGSKITSHCGDLEGRPFVKLEGQEEEFI